MKWIEHIFHPHPPAAEKNERWISAIMDGRGAREDRDGVFKLR